MDVYGAEPDPRLIEISKQIYKQDLGIKQGGALDIDTFNKTFDNIIMIDVLEHIEKDEKVLDYLKSFIAPNGQLLIVVPAYQFLYGPRDKEIGHFRRYTASGLKKKLENNGYDILELGYWNMLGVFVYFVISKVLKKKTAMNFRTNKKKGGVSKTINTLLHWWVRTIENNINLGFGLSVVCRARPKKN
jgi:SAM-dependent methyltransferase